MKYSLFIILLFCQVAWGQVKYDTIFLDASMKNAPNRERLFNRWVKNVNDSLNLAYKWVWHPTSGDDQNGYYILFFKRKPK